MNWSGLPERIENDIIPEPNSGCWLWIGRLRTDDDDYGGVWYDGRHQRAHRFVYNFLRGKIPSALCLDHLCKNKFCCNPDHLEPVTWGVNIRRGQGVAAKNAAKTHCSRGHEYTPENTYIWKNQRFCRTCHNERTLRAYRRKKASEQEWREYLLEVNST